MNQLTMNQRLKILIALASNFPDITLEWFEYGSSPRTHDAKDYHVFQFTVVTTKKPAIQWIASELLLF